MAKFSIIKAASTTRPERVVEWPDPFVKKPDGTPVEFALRPIGSDDEALVIERATEFARKRGVIDPKRGDALYDLGEMLNALALSAVDIDSPRNARELFFESAEELRLNSQREVLVYLYERLEVFQSETSPFQYQMDAAQLMSAAKMEASSVDDRFFTRLGPNLRWSFVHTLACLVDKCPEAQSLLSSLFESSGPSTPETKSEPAPPTAPVLPAPPSPTPPTASLTTPPAADAPVAASPDPTTPA